MEERYPELRAFRTWFNAGQGSPEERYPGFPGFRTTFDIAGDDAETRKRVLTCLAVLLMPREGVDENFETTVECLRYYHAAQSLPALPPKAEPPKVAGTVSGYITRPDLVLAEG